MPQSVSASTDLLNSYAIVAYVSGPIGRFADRLRCDLAPGSSYHAHITVLPPRPLPCPPAEAMEFARQLVAQFEPFEVRVGAVEVFDPTQVIYIGVVSGVWELKTMHDVLNTGCLRGVEPFDYVPHVTLGQQLPPEMFQRCVEECRRRWKEFGPPPPVRIETLTFVQQRADGRWEDLVELALGRVTVS
jgi:2'-5' RNA ligase